MSIKIETTEKHLISVSADRILFSSSIESNLSKQIDKKMRRRQKKIKNYIMTKRIDCHYVIFMFEYEAKKILRPNE